MLNFFLGVFLVACRSEWSILTLKRRGNARDFFFGRFSGRLPIGIGPFKTPEGGKRLPIFFWVFFWSLADRNGPF